MNLNPKLDLNSRATFAECSSTYSPKPGCWHGMNAKREVNVFRDWLVKIMGFHEKSVVVERSGAGLNTEYRIYFPALREYWWPQQNTKAAWEAELDDKRRKYIG